MILATALTWTLLGQLGGGFAGPSPLNNPFFTTASLPGAPTFAGSKLDLTGAEKQAHTIRVGRPTSLGGLMLQGSVLMGVCDLKSSEILKGATAETAVLRFGITAADGEILPKVGDDYVFFLARRRDADVIIKVLAATPSNLDAVRRVIQAAEARLLNSDLPIPEAQYKAHTIVVAEGRVKAVVGSGGIAYGSCDLKVSSALKGDATAVDGKSIGFTTTGGGKLPEAGRSYLFFIGTADDRDTILKVEPADAWRITWIERVEADLRAIQAGAPRRIPGANFTIAEAEGRSHTVLVGVAGMYVEVGAGGFGGASCSFQVTAVLKGEARPGDRIGASYRPPDQGINPHWGESFLVFIANVGKAGDRAVPEVVKMLPATPENIDAVRQARQEREAHCLAGQFLTVAEAEAKAKTVVVAAVNNVWGVGAGGLIQISLGLDTTATLKGDAKPLARSMVGWFASGDGKWPQVGESFVIWIGSDQGADSILKMTFATPGNIRAARDQVQAAATPSRPARPAAVGWGGRPVRR